MNRAIIISSDKDSASLLRQLVLNEGYGMSSLTSSGSEARRMIKSETQPELVIINTPLSDEFGQEIAELTAETTSAGVILICSNDIYYDIAEKFSEYGIITLSKPINPQIVSNAIRIISSTRSRMMGLEKENAGIIYRIDEMRLINRAKAVLMKYLRFTEPQAHKYIEKQAMNTRRTRKETAMRILNTYEK